MKKSIWILLIILGIATFMRVVSLDTAPPGLYTDEAINGNNAIEALETGNYQIFYPENHGREGLFINLQALSIATFGRSVQAIRFPSAIFGLLTIIGVYLLCRELFENEAIAIAASFLIAISFWHINFSRIAFRAIAAPFFITWSLYLILLSLRKIKDSKATAYIISIIGGLIFGLGFYTYTAYRITPLILLALFPMFKKRKGSLMLIALFILSTLLTMLPLTIHYINNPDVFVSARISFISVFNNPNPISNLTQNTLDALGMFNFSGDTNWRHNIASKPHLSWPVGLTFIAGIAVIFMYLFKKQNTNQYSLLIVWLIAGIIPSVILNEITPHALRSIIAIPPTLIISAIGMVYIFETFIKSKIKNPTIRMLGVALVASLMTANAYNTYFTKWAKHPETALAFNQAHIETSKGINSLPIETQKIVVLKDKQTLVRGIPMISQSVMFLTDSFDPQKAKMKNIQYVLEEEFQMIKDTKDAKLFYIDAR